MNTTQLSQHTPRSGFEALDPADLGGLSDAQRDTITRLIVAEGPALIRRGQTERLAGMAGLTGALAAAAALVFFIVESQAAETKTSLPPLALVASSSETDAPPTPHGEVDRSSVQIGARDRAVTTRATRRPQEQARATGTSMRTVSLASSTSIGAVEGEVVTRALHGEERGSKDVNGPLDDRAGLSQEPAQDAGPTPKLAARSRTRAPIPAAGAEAQSKVAAERLLAQAEKLWREGDHRAARRAFRVAARDRGPSGEAAWVRLARLELSSGSCEQALMALSARKDRAEKGLLGAEALWLEAQALERAGRSNQAVKAAEALLRDYPNSPQAAAARRLVAEGRQQ